jgi:hypothetical protein
MGRRFFSSVDSSNIYECEECNTEITSLELVLHEPDKDYWVVKNCINIIISDRKHKLCDNNKLQRVFRKT